MEKYIIINGLKQLLSALTFTALIHIAEGILDMFENSVVASETKLDDKILQPIIESIRAALNSISDDEQIETKGKA